LAIFNQASENRKKEASTSKTYSSNESHSSQPMKSVQTDTLDLEYYGIANIRNNFVQAVAQTTDNCVQAVAQITDSCVQAEVEAIKYNEANVQAVAQTIDSSVQTDGEATGTTGTNFSIESSTATPSQSSFDTNSLVKPFHDVPNPPSFTVPVPSDANSVSMELYSSTKSTDEADLNQNSDSVELTADTNVSHQYDKSFSDMGVVTDPFVAPSIERAKVNSSYYITKETARNISHPAFHDVECMTGRELLLSLLQDLSNPPQAKQVSLVRSSSPLCLDTNKVSCPTLLNRDRNLSPTSVVSDSFSTTTNYKHTNFASNIFSNILIKNINNFI
jgi:hypothetical protein